MNFNSISNNTKIKKDISGGFLAAIVGLPMGLAFGVQSGLGAQAGIYTAIILAVVASILGGTKTLISDPTGPMTVVAATIVTMAVRTTGDLDNAIPLILGTFLLAGIFELIFGLLDFGKYVKYMPYPVVSSFMTGIGIIIIAMQLFPLLGYDSPKGFINIMSNIETPLLNMNVSAVLLGLFTIGVIYLMPRISQKLPSILVALVGSTFLAVSLDLDVPVIGQIPRELPSLQISALLSIQWSDLHLMIMPALMIGGLGVIDSLLTSVVADNLTDTKHDSRITVIGQGLGNIVTALFGGIPGAGATVGTVTNIKAGGNTRFSGFMKGVFLLLIMVGIANYIEMIPMSVLAAILIYTGISIIDTKGIKMLFKVPKQDTLVWALVLLFTIFNNLLNAVAAGFILASILFIVQVVNSMSTAENAESYSDTNIDIEIPKSLVDKIFVQNIDGPIFFGFAEKYREISNSIVDKEIVIVRLGNVPFLDQTGIITLKNVIKDWQNNGVNVYITGAKPNVMSILLNNNIVPSLIPNEHNFINFNSCISHITNKQNIGTSKKSEYLEEVV